ncbi:MAG: hypothetical protein JO163_19010 [Methylobacteriaceae bacterium]|nr:hypothetical protein [Methylobacteriaceae bacterium]
MSKLVKITVASLSVLGAVALSGTPGWATSHRSYCVVAGNCGPDTGFQGSYYYGGPGAAPVGAAPAWGAPARYPESGWNGTYEPAQ